MISYKFTANTLTIGEKVFPARYELQDDADMKRGQLYPTVHIWATVDEKAVLIDVPADDPEYYAALKACQETPADHSTEEEAPTQAEEEAPQAQEEAPADHSTEEEAPAQAEEEAPQAQEEAPADHSTEEEAPAQAEEEAPQAQEETPADHSTEEAPARDPKQARGPIPEKTFAGTSINGACYKILFDDVAQRTRVIIPQEHRDALRAAVEKAGFYYSPILDSWNKKLTFKAYRAAQALALELDKLAA